MEGVLNTAPRARSPPPNPTPHLRNSAVSVKIAPLLQPTSPFMSHIQCLSLPRGGHAACNMRALPPSCASPVTLVSAPSLPAANSFAL